MERLEIDRRVAERKEQLTGSLDAHIAALEELATTTNFDFDVATDVHPHLIDDRPKGREQLKEWQDLYESLAKGPQAVVTLRWSDRLSPGCYGFGAKPRYETNAFWLRVYEDVTADDLKFIKGEDGEPSRVVIDKPHDLLEWYPSSDTGKTVSELAERKDSAVLYSQDLRSIEEKFHAYPTEDFADNQVIICRDTLKSASNALNYKTDEFLSLRASSVVYGLLWGDSYINKYVVEAAKENN